MECTGGNKPKPLILIALSREECADRVFHERVSPNGTERSGGGTPHIQFFIV